MNKTLQHSKWKSCRLRLLTLQKTSRPEELAEQLTELIRDDDHYDDLLSEPYTANAI